MSIIIVLRKLDIVQCNDNTLYLEFNKNVSYLHPQEGHSCDPFKRNDKTQVLHSGFYTIVT
jgi:hypothetical protein